MYTDQGDTVTFHIQFYNMIAFGIFYIPRLNQMESTDYIKINIYELIMPLI